MAVRTFIGSRTGTIGDPCRVGPAQVVAWQPEPVILPCQNIPNLLRGSVFFGCAARVQINRILKMVFVNGKGEGELGKK